MMSDLSGGLVTEILDNSAAKKNQFLGFMMMDDRVCSLRFDLQGIRNEGEGGDLLVDPSVNQISLLDQIEVHKLFHCDGLVLCVLFDGSKLLAWNPYLGQTRWIQPMKSFHLLDRYALGYDNINNRNHKVLRFVDDYVTEEDQPFGYEIYDFSSDSWRVLDVTPDWDIVFYQRGMSLKGNSYFHAQQKLMPGVEPEDDDIDTTDLPVFLLCFDFTAERFGPRLPLPFHSYGEETVSLSCVREEQLAVLYHNYNLYLEIWITTKIEPTAVSWSRFLVMDMKPITGFKFCVEAGSFFIDEDKNVAVVFDLDGYKPTETCRYQSAHIIGQDGYFKSVNFREAPNLGTPDSYGFTSPIYCVPLVCPSYVPSSVQI
ncbi:hypothetical protein CARUB_v10015248mg [Capsella rubella]|uniref:F-box associated beta-propeller type 1 domain-containing protein n=2 Tax=Capsella rubella TaxID=81985 RepID=R0G8S1_9BRAS|nr:hypothetical protein CARUB_v10015248mg [Capsella rubella]